MHIRTAHQLDNPPLFVCPICSQSFSHKHVLGRHIGSIHENSSLRLEKREERQQARARESLCGVVDDQAHNETLVESK